MYRDRAVFGHALIIWVTVSCFCEHILQFKSSTCCCSLAFSYVLVARSLISDRWKTKQDKYRELGAGIKHQYPDYKVNQINVVFDFLAEYHQSLKNDLNEHLTGKNEEETQYLIMKSQKWIISQNAEIVKNFYTYKR